MSLEDLRKHVEIEYLKTLSLEQINDILRKAGDKVSAQQTRIEKLEAMLKKLEWDTTQDDQYADGYGEPSCSICSKRRSLGHAQDCELDALLKEK